MNRKPYPSDVTDEEWAFVAPYLTLMSEDAPHREHFFQVRSKADESYFGGKRVKGKRGRGASGKRIVFGIYKRNGKVFTEIVPNVQKKTLQAIIRGREH